MLSHASLASELGGIDPARRNQWIHLFTLGVIAARDGRRFVLADAEAVLRRTLARARAMDIPVDYEHQTDFANKNGKPAPAAGWIKRFEVRNNGIWGLVEWTARAAAMIGAREYRYISPTFRHDPTGRVTLIERAALTNDPAFELTALARRHGENSMAISERIAEALGLSVDADEDTVLETLAGLKMPGTDQESVRAVASAVAALNEERRSTLEMRINEKVDAGIASGSFPPALRGWALSLARRDEASFDEFVKTVGTPFAYLGKPQISAEMIASARARFNANHDEGGEAEKVARQLGVSPDDLRK